MKVNSTLLSICIPTKNRYNTLVILLEYLMESKSDAFEVIVLDTSDHIQNIGISDPRLKIFRESSDYSVIDSFDYVVKKARGKWLIVLGDDDCIDIDSSLAVLMSLSSCDALTCSKANYTWPDVVHRAYGNGLSGKLRLQKNYKGAVQYIDNEHVLNKLLSTCGVNGLGKLPRIYHGFLKSDLANALIDLYGTLFLGPSPDMASSVLIATSTNLHYHVDLPLVISGHSAASTAGQANRGKHHGSLEKIKHLPKNTKDTWSKRIPLFWSAGTIYAQSLESTLRATRNYALLDKMNFRNLYSHLFVYNSNYTEAVKLCIDKEASEYIRILINTLSVLIRRFLKLFNNLFLKRFAYNVRPGVINIAEAMRDVVQINKRKL